MQRRSLPGMPRSAALSIRFAIRSNFGSIIRAEVVQRKPLRAVGWNVADIFFRKSSFEFTAFPLPCLLFPLFFIPNSIFSASCHGINRPVDPSPPWLWPPGYLRRSQFFSPAKDGCRANARFFLPAADALKTNPSGFFRITDSL